MSENRLEERKTDEMMKLTKSKEEKEKFVNDNISILPRNWQRKFDSLSLDLKVAKIQHYIDFQREKEEIVNKNKLENKVKNLFVKKKATTEDVVRVIDFCKQYIQLTKEEEITKLQSEIERLTYLKHTLENN